MLMRNRRAESLSVFWSKDLENSSIRQQGISNVLYPSPKNKRAFLFEKGNNRAPLFITQRIEFFYRLMRNKRAPLCFNQE